MEARIRPKPHRAVTVLGVIAVVVGMSIVGFIVLSETHHGDSKSGNEREAAISLKTLWAAEQAFRDRDLNHNGTADFWTADVTGLYCMSTTWDGVPSAAE